MSWWRLRSPPWTLPQLKNSTKPTIRQQSSPPWSPPPCSSRHLRWWARLPEHRLHWNHLGLQNRLNSDSLRYRGQQEASYPGAGSLHWCWKPQRKTCSLLSLNTENSALLSPETQQRRPCPSLPGPSTTSLFDTVEFSESVRNDTPYPCYELKHEEKMKKLKTSWSYSYDKVDEAK